MGKQEFRYFTFLSQGQTTWRWWFSCTVVAKPLAHFRFLLCMTRILRMGVKDKILRNQLCPLQLVKGCLPNGVEGQVLPWQTVWPSLCTHIGSVGSLILKPPSYFTAVFCIVEAFLNISKTWRTKPDCNRNYSLSKAYPAVGHPFCNTCQTKQSEQRTQDDFFFPWTPLGWSFERLKVISGTESCFWVDWPTPSHPQLPPTAGGVCEPENQPAPTPCCLR